MKMTEEYWTQYGPLGHTASDWPLVDFVLLILHASSSLWFLSEVCLGSVNLDELFSPAII